MPGALLRVIFCFRVEDDDTDYEKALKLYVYCADYFVYGTLITKESVSHTIHSEPKKTTCAIPGHMRI